MLPKSPAQWEPYYGLIKPMSEGDLVYLACNALAKSLSCLENKASKLLKIEIALCDHDSKVHALLK